MREIEYDQWEKQSSRLPAMPLYPQVIIQKRELHLYLKKRSYWRDILNICALKLPYVWVSHLAFLVNELFDARWIPVLPDSKFTTMNPNANVNAKFTRINQNVNIS